MKIGVKSFKNSENTIEFSEFFYDFAPIFVKFSTNFLKKKTPKKIEKACYRWVQGAL